jgi:hypothetical protein
MTIQSKIELEPKVINTVRQRVSRKMRNIVGDDEVETQTDKPFVRNRLHKKVHDWAFEEVIREIFVKSDKNKDLSLDADELKTFLKTVM